jgi:hypothetical protein
MIIYLECYRREWNRKYYRVDLSKVGVVFKALAGTGMVNLKIWPLGDVVRYIEVSAYETIDIRTDIPSYAKPEGLPEWA